ncbi:MAG: hypothetical protein J07AB43_09370 [Candidatus Nanosalina sp. J07AB43]|jgi:hypothetical protein|nr:MAG: hypothetical protein J07AB43_09370 [Candidatus Nanosalina sp. J07AB43]
MTLTDVIVLDHVSEASSERFAQLLESSDISEDELENWMDEFESSLMVPSQSSAFHLRSLMESMEDLFDDSEHLYEVFEQAKTDRNHNSSYEAELSSPREPVIDHEEFYRFLVESVDDSSMEIDYSEVSSDRFGLRLAEIFRLPS